MIDVPRHATAGVIGTVTDFEGSATDRSEQ